MKKISLAHMKAGQKGKLVEIAGGGNLHARLMSMGLNKGRELTKLSSIGLRGPVVVKAGRTILALGHGVASKMVIETA